MNQNVSEYASKSRKFMLRIEAALKMEARISRQHQQLKTQSQGLELAVLKPQKMGDPKKVYGCFFFLGRELRNSRTKKDETIFSPRKVDGMKFKRHFRAEIPGPILCLLQKQTVN